MKAILVLICMLAAQSCFAQSFEGIVVYHVEAEVAGKMKVQGMTHKDLVDAMKSQGTWADTIEISYRNGNYAILMNNEQLSRSVYRADSNKIFTFENGSDICTVTDAAKDLEAELMKAKPSVTQLDTVAMVANHECRVVRVQWRNLYYDHYYNSSVLPVDPELYSGHAYDGWYEFLKISRSLPLKTVKTIKGVSTVTYTLAAIRPQTIDNTAFALPELTSDPTLIAIPNKAVMRIKGK